MTPMKSFCQWTALVAALTLLLDQASKEVVRRQLALCTAPPLAACDRLDVAGPLGFVRLENTGGVTGIGEGLGLWLLVAALGLLLIPLYGSRMRAARGPGRGLGALAVGLQTGGADGILLDRLFAGGAVDFIDLRPVPLIFNLADVAIVAGAIVACGLLLRASVVETADSRRSVPTR